MASQYIVVVGCGRLGSMLASRLSSQGNSVVVIDPYESSFNNLSSDFSGFQITGDASEIEILRSAKVEQADCLLAVTDKDNINLMVTQIAKQVFQTSIVLARVFRSCQRKDVIAILESLPLVRRSFLPMLLWLICLAKLLRCKL